MLGISAYHIVTVVHVTDQNWISKTVYCIRCVMVCKIGFTNWNAKIAFLQASMLITYNIKLFRTGADRHNGILMSLPLFVAEANSKEQNILGVIIDNKLKSNKWICKKASQKLAALYRLSSYLHNSEKKIIFNSITKSQFSYCLVWMFCSKTSSNMINKLHERSLRIILNHYSSDFNILLEKNDDICNHHGNLQALLIEVLKMKNELVPPIMELILNKRFNNYNLGNFRESGTEKKEPFVIILKPSATAILNSGTMCRKASRKWIL